MDEFTYAIREEKQGISNLMGIFPSRGIARAELQRLFEEKIGQKRCTKIILEECALTYFELRSKTVVTMEPF